MLVELAVVLLVCSVCTVDGHGRFIEPPSRGSAWRYGFDTPKDYGDNELFCGGFQRQWKQNGGKCGACGDAWDDATRPHEAGGKFATGLIVRKYTEGQAMQVKVDLTANHKGYFEFRICPNNDPSKRVTLDCLDRHVLNIAGHGTRYMVPNVGAKIITLDVTLPLGLTCTQCVVQWKYHAGNSWNPCGNGTGAVGCGPQENFRGCSDVSISAISSGGNGSPSTTTKSPTVTETPSVSTKAPSSGSDCYGEAPWDIVPGIDAWCTTTCKTGNCPTSVPKCKCGGMGSSWK